jgi:alanine racemase
MVPAGVRVEPVVKADAYGHGAVPVALALQAAGADGFSVATLDEALELRQGGVTLPVVVLYPVPAAWIAEAARRRIAVSLAAGEPARRVLAAATAAAAAGAPELEVHVEIETGLGRGGVLPGAATEAVDAVLRTPGVRLGGIWMHLAAAERIDLSVVQDERFSAALAALPDAVAWGADPGSGVRRHTSGSGGVLGGAMASREAVRIGLSIYGLIPGGVVPARAASPAAAGLRPVMAVVTRPVRVAELPPGHGVSYGPSFVTARRSRIATLPIGYADGWRRFLTDRAEGLVRGVRVPLVGRVAMDAVMADVTDVPGPPVDEDDEIVLLGTQGGASITADDLAATGGTISHEIVTGMSRRMPRVYHAAGSPVDARTLVDGGPRGPDGALERGYL